MEPFGIRVLIVEPGAFRTGLHGSAMRESAVMPEYDSIVGPTRAAQREMAGVEPGDPAKAASAILAALDADSPRYGWCSATTPPTASWPISTRSGPNSWRRSG